MRKKIVDKKFTKVNVVNFYIEPGTSDDDIDKIELIADLLCISMKEKPEKIKLMINISITGKEKKESCIDGWEFSYNLEDPATAKFLAETLSLLRPVCNISYKVGRFTVCIDNEWIQCVNDF